MPAVPGSSIVTKKIKKSNECESSKQDIYSNNSMLSPPARKFRRKIFPDGWMKNSNFALWLKRCGKP